jgi:hypothetical protein
MGRRQNEGEKRGKINVEGNFEVDLHGWCIEHLVTAN